MMSEHCQGRRALWWMKKGRVKRIKDGLKFYVKNSELPFALLLVFKAFLLGLYLRLTACCCCCCHQRWLWQCCCCLLLQFKAAVVRHQCRGLSLVQDDGLKFYVKNSELPFALLLVFKAFLLGLYLRLTACCCCCCHRRWLWQCCCCLLLQFKAAVVRSPVWRPVTRSDKAGCCISLFLKLCKITHICKLT